MEMLKVITVFADLAMAVFTVSAYLFDEKDVWCLVVLCVIAVNLIVILGIS